MGSRFSSIPKVSRFSSIQKGSNMILPRPALALLPFFFSCGFSAHLSSTTESVWLNPCSLKLDCPEGSSSQTVNGDCQCVPTGSPTGMRKKRSQWLDHCHKLQCPRGESGKTVNGDCQCVPTGSPRPRRSLSVDCGNGWYADSCEECIQGKGMRPGSEGCKRVCEWVGPRNNRSCLTVSGER